MKKGTICEGVIDELLFPNRGVMAVNQEKVIVKNALPGQKVRACVNKTRSGKTEARLLELLSPSPMETESDPCPHYGICGGCLYQTIPYAEQVKIKEEQVRKLLEPVLGRNLPMEPALASPGAQGYRNKMEYSFGDEQKGGPMTLGMHRRGSFYDVVTVDQCRIADRDFGLILRTVLDYMTERNVPFYKKMSREGILRHLLIRKTGYTGQILVDLITTSSYTFPEMLAERLLKLPLEGTITGILHTVNDSPADAVINEGTKIIFGKDTIREELLGLSFYITPFSFFQTNTFGAEVLYSLVREFIGETRDKTIYDLYSGTGTIAQILAPVARRVVGVEIVEEAVEAARINAEENHLENCEFLAGDVLRVLDNLQEAPDLLVLDPPRDGVHPKALKKILDYGVERIVYISCKPTSLARDLPHFLEAGYRAERVRCVDMFPGSGNIETVALLSKLSEAKHHISVQVDMDELDLTAAESKATYEEIKEWVQEKYGFHVTHLNIAKTKRKCGIIERQNYNLPKSENSRSPETPKEKEEAIIDAFKHFQMI